MILPTDITSKLSVLTARFLFRAVAVAGEDQIEVGNFVLMLGPGVWIDYPSGTGQFNGPNFVSNPINDNWTGSYDIHKKTHDGATIYHRCVFSVADKRKVKPGVIFAAQAVEPYFPAAGGMKQENGGESMICELHT